jgi:hypothetical protein
MTAMRRAVAVGLTMFVYLGISCLLYRIRTLSGDWDDLYHSDLVVFVFPGLVTGAVSYLVLRRLGVGLATSVLVTLGCLVVTFGVFLFVAFNAWGT